MLQTHALTPNTAYYGHFSCPPMDADYKYSLMSAKEFYETHALTEDGHLVASHPGENGSRVEHTFDKNRFCLVHLQVLQEESFFP